MQLHGQGWSQKPKVSGSSSNNNKMSRGQGRITMKSRVIKLDFIDNLHEPYKQFSKVKKCQLTLLGPLWLHLCSWYRNPTLLK